MGKTYEFDDNHDIQIIVHVEIPTKSYRFLGDYEFEERRGCKSANHHSVQKVVRNQTQ